jgi:hypothetical protein
MIAGERQMKIPGTPSRIDTFPEVTRTITVMPEDVDRWETGG